MVFYNGGTIQNVDGPGQGLTTAQSYPKDFTFTGSDAKFNGWKGSSKTQSNDWHTWNTSDFGYTADMVMHQTKNVDLVIEKKDTTTAEALKGTVPINMYSPLWGRRATRSTTGSRREVLTAFMTIRIP